MVTEKFWKNCTNVFTTLVILGGSFELVMLNETVNASNIEAALKPEELRTQKLIEFFGIDKDGRTLADCNVETYGYIGRYIGKAVKLLLNPSCSDFEIIRTFDLFTEKYCSFKEILAENISKETFQRRNQRQNAKREVFLECVQVFRVYLSNAIKLVDDQQKKEELSKLLMNDETALFITETIEEVRNASAAVLNEKKNQYFAAIKDLLQILFNKINEESK